nr:ABC transporter ATP-binding protein [Maliibacterium massiliense]
MDAINVQDLCKTYAGFTLNNISMRLPMGSIMGFIGENGAGKTTTIASMLGLISSKSRRLELLGEPAGADNRALRERIGVVFDDCRFPEELRVRDINRFMGRIYARWDADAFGKHTKRFSLPENKPIKTFSKGMKTKLSIAAAMSHHAELLLLDEATSGLDPVARDELLEMLQAFIEDERHAVLLSSHITSDLDKIADYITFIHEGNLIFSQSRDALSDNMGILKCSPQELAGVDAGVVLRVRRSAFSTEALITDRAGFLRRHPGAVVDPVTLEEIMLFYVRGDRQ